MLLEGFHRIVLVRIVLVSDLFAKFGVLHRLGGDHRDQDRGHSPSAARAGMFPATGISTPNNTATTSRRPVTVPSWYLNAECASK